MNFRSLNIDGVYQVEHFAREGETILVGKYVSSIEGKGLNQSTALARAGAYVIYVGAIRSDDMELKTTLGADGVDTGYIMQVPEASGHAVIQIANGESSIIVYGRANRTVDHTYVCEVLDEFGPDDLLLIQNEISCVPYVMKQAKVCGVKVAINAPPITAELLEYPLELADYIIVNEQEGGVLAGSSDTSYEEILDSMAKKYRAVISLTTGDEGAYYQSGETQYYQPVIKADAVNTTGAGDTFCEYFLTGLSEGVEPGGILKMVATTAAVTVGRPGASKSISWRAEIII